MGFVRGLAVGIGALGLIGLSAAPAAADSVTVDSAVVETSNGTNTVTFTTVGEQWTRGSTQLLFLTEVCGEGHCDSTGTFSADDGQGSGVTGTFSSSLVVDSTAQPLFRSHVDVSFSVTGGFGSYSGATGSGQLSADGQCFSGICDTLIGTEQLQFTTPSAGLAIGRSGHRPGHHGGGAGHPNGGR